MPFLTHEFLNHNTKKPTFPFLLHCVELNYPTHSHLIVIIIKIRRRKKEKKKKMQLSLMASKFLNSLKDRRKQNNKDGTDELALVKAAAWAWYQHGSGSEGKAMSEFGVTRTQRTPRPSRYKLEAMRMINDEAKDHEGSSSSSSPPLHNRNSLLDAYEVQSISRQIGSFIESSNNNNHHNNNNKKLVSGKDNASSASLDSGKRMVKKKKSKKGFWLRHAAVCGRGEDVVDPSASLRDRQSAKRVPAVNLIT